MWLILEQMFFIFRYAIMISMENIKSITEKRREALESIGITNIYELLAHAPKYYIDMNDIKMLSDFSSDFCVAKVYIKNKPRVRFFGGRKSIIEMDVFDGISTIKCYWFNQPYIAKKDITKEYLIIGKLTSFKGQKVFVHPMLEESIKASCGITPFYQLPKGINQKTMRVLIQNALDYAREYNSFSEGLLSGLIGGSTLLAYSKLHFPKSFFEIEEAKNYLKYEETLYFACAMSLIHGDFGKALPISISDHELNLFRETLPYKFTGAQIKASKEIALDLSSDKPMNRLLQGDVGCGKTVVAVEAIYSAAKNGYQTAFMSPTEVLAVQNYEVCYKLLNSFGIRVAILTGSTKAKERREILAALKSGEIDVLVGTHALIQDDVEFSKLDLVITDEQHRFGVKQRAKLSKDNVHTLIMSATPIPRTLALIAFEKLHISIIDQMPAGRQEISSHVVGSNKREDMYEFVLKQCKNNEQCYVVCPLIDQSEMFEAKSATEIFEELNKKFGKQVNIKLLHGRQKAQEKNEILDSFRAGDVQILVSTTVIEVGVNVPNATIMIIENAERFGLAQLHQLRGRVGRGSKKSFCFAVTNNPNSIERLTIFKDNSDGLTLAKYDLSVRGMGEFLGFAQHGSYVFKFTDLYEDVEIINKVQAYILKMKGSKEYSSLVKLTKLRYASILKEVILN